MCHALRVRASRMDKVHVFIGKTHPPAARGRRDSYPAMSRPAGRRTVRISPCAAFTVTGMRVSLSVEGTHQGQPVDVHARFRGLGTGIMPGGKTGLSGSAADSLRPTSTASRAGRFTVSGCAQIRDCLIGPHRHTPPRWDAGRGASSTGTYPRGAYRRFFSTLGKVRVLRLHRRKLRLGTGCGHPPRQRTVDDHHTQRGTIRSGVRGISVMGHTIDRRKNACRARKCQDRHVQASIRTPWTSPCAKNNRLPLRGRHAVHYQPPTPANIRSVLRGEAPLGRL